MLVGKLCKAAGRHCTRAAAHTRPVVAAVKAQQQLSMTVTTEATSAWEGSGTQEDFMVRDNCIVVDGADTIQGSANKFDCHRFLPEQPNGRLHRAFSVFLFNSKGELLLQQRAASKITFPSVWTNTCCSHQLYGQDPDEVDSPETITAGTVPGAKAAAVRKLQHELGIDPQQLPASSFKYLTRLHYYAADTDTHGPESPWGEHEVDYILLAQAEVALNPNPDEVQAVRYVSLPQLQEMMSPASGLSWSPWFRIIATHFLPSWWSDLKTTLTTTKHVDTHTVHRLSC